MFRSHLTIIREHVDLSQSYHWPLIYTLHFGAAEACLYEVLGYVCIPLLMCILRCYAWKNISKILFASILVPRVREKEGQHWQSPLYQCKATYFGMSPSFPRGSVRDTSPTCHSPLQHGLRQATHNTSVLGSWSTVSYLFRDRPVTWQVPGYPPPTNVPGSQSSLGFSTVFKNPHSSLFISGVFTYKWKRENVVVVVIVVVAADGGEVISSSLWHSSRVWWRSWALVCRNWV